MDAEKPGLVQGLTRALTAAAMLAAPALASGQDPVADARLEALPPASRALALRMLADIRRFDERYFGRVARLNGVAVPGDLVLERLELENDDSVYQVEVARGPVVEKAGRMVQAGKKQQPGRPTAPLVWGRFYSWDVHPATPRVGMLHATLVLQFYADGTAAAVGWLGIMNGARVEADMARMGVLVDDYFSAAGVNPAVYHKLMVKGTDDTVSAYRRRPDPSGVSFYGPPVFADDPARSYEFVSGLFGRFTDAYFDLIEAHKAETGTAEEVALRDAMRKRWLLDQLFSDPFSSKLVPFEVWSLANVPPVIKF